MDKTLGKALFVMDQEETLLESPVLNGFASEMSLFQVSPQKAAGDRAFLRLAAAHHLDLSRSFAVSNHPQSLAAARRAGVLGLFLLSGPGLNHLKEVPAGDLLFHDLTEAVDWIRAHPRGMADLEESIRRGAEALRAGGLTAFATETVYGLGADALNPEAVKKIFRAKQRPAADPLIVHIARLEQLENLVTEISPAAEALMNRWWPGPLTLVLPKRGAVPDTVSSGHPTVGVRMPAHPWARRLIEEAGVPVAAPSANLFGRTSPTTAAHVAQQLGGACDIIVDAGACRVGVESTVLSLTGEVPVLLREGGITREQLEEFLGVPLESKEKLPEAERVSPGLMESHYAPQIPLSLAEVPGDLARFTGEEDRGILFFEDNRVPGGLQPGDFAGPVEILSRRGDAAEAAVNLYAALRNLDRISEERRARGASPLKGMTAPLLPPAGMGQAVNDRLRKAAGRG